MRYVFDDCTLDTERYELHRAGVRIPLRSKVFQLLAYLIAHHDRVVLKDELIAHLWPNQFIGDTALKSCIMTARKAVGDAGRSQRIIQTLHGHGYRVLRRSCWPLSVFPEPSSRCRSVRSRLP